MIKLDKKDRQLLFELDRNARQPISVIAKKIGVSKQVAKYRLDRLTEQGVILGYDTWVRAERFGFINFKISLQFSDVSAEKEKEIIDYFKNHPHVTWLVSSDGRWDVMMQVTYSDVFLFDQFLKKMTAKYGQNIREKEVEIYTRLMRFDLKYLADEIPPQKLVGDEPVEVIKFDKIDVKILLALTENARTPVIELARKLNLSVNTIKTRIKSLVEKKAILGFRVRQDYTLLGYTYYSLMIKLQNMVGEKEKKMIEFCSNHPNVLVLYAGIGLTDLALQIQVKSSQEFHEILRALRNKFGHYIKQYEILIMTKEHTRGHFRVGKKFLKD
jgi:DNA-binding Lrp family transcriptional regulator